MNKPSVFGRIMRRGLLVVLVALAGAVVYLWLFRAPNDAQTFGRIYQASVTQAGGNLRLASALGTPLRADEHAAHYEFFNKDGHRHVRFRFPLQGARRSAVIEGEAMLLGHNWLILSLIATFPGHAIEINLSPGIVT